MKDWSYITDLVRNRTLSVQRVRIIEDNVTIDGDFELPPLARLSVSDQVFVAFFVKCHGSIKKMESYFGISYPTVKKRLENIASTLEFVETRPAKDLTDLTLSRIEAGEISADEAIEILANAGKDN